MRLRPAPTRNTSAAGSSEASFAKAIAARAAPSAAVRAGPSPGGSAPSEAAGSARLRITAAGSAREIGIDRAPDNPSRGARSERDGAAPRESDARRPLRYFVQPEQILVGHQLGGDGEDTALVVADQHRVAAAQRGDRAPRMWPAPGSGAGAPCCVGMFPGSDTCFLLTAAADIWAADNYRGKPIRRNATAAHPLGGERMEDRPSAKMSIARKRVAAVVIRRFEEAVRIV